ncbi:neuroglian isoform X2 [Condylostylus longicornis]|uniref:neuroglian isoform X2 n=1 Tax=Condylostylus longicornis TaxID=2530218 RepID=UPI00244E1380|nr:neuroglian isoform X2 [Condylostylus longicornis]XP_055389471.1 neuroglian isoform X2 [Condylostylus longicornis]XP_055389474.1 neuroglian isoform X2 [Condylostylus longicornis]
MLQQPGRGTLVITSPKDEDLGQYQCFAENEFGVATSNSVFVRKAELNAFKDDAPKEVQANEGAPFQLQCEPPDGWPKPTVNWLIQGLDGGIKSINNSRMTLDPEGNLWFSNVTREDASDDFYYACSATSVFRNEYKIGNRILLNVVSTGISPGLNKHEPKRQYVTRKQETALRGKKIELYCIYGGTPLPQIVWKKDGRDLHWNDRVTQGNYGKSLVIRRVNSDDAGSYTCEASNGIGNAQSYNINLRVLSIPYFTVEPEIQNAAEEEEVTFRCEASGVPEPTIKWIHNGKPIEQAPQNPRRIVQNNQITIKNLEKSDTGNYGCNATNSLGYVYKDVYLNVLALPPEITEPPQSKLTVDGQNVTMRCRVFGAPKPIVKWIRNNLALTGGRYHIMDTGDLLIQSVSFADAGNYECYAKNKLGDARAHGNLDVKEHTRITEAPSDYEVAAGNSATFRCNAASDNNLELEILWQKNGEDIDFEQEVRFVKTNDHSLTIAKTVELDSGVYTCVAKTALDSASEQATLIVQDVPNPPELISTDCYAEEALIRWQPQGDNRSPILHYTIQYNTSFTPETWEVAFEKVPSTDFSHRVPMSPWANYTFRVIAHNKIGPSIPSPNGESCSTQPAVPGKNPYNVIGKGTNPNNMVISWTPMPEIEHNGPDFHYRVFWKRDSPGSQWENVDIYDWKQSHYEVVNQPTFVRYIIKVIAINRQGESNIAPVETFGYSGEDRPTQAPTNFSMIQVTNSISALLSWNPVAPETVRGHFRGYKIQTWTEAEGEDNYREIQVKPDSNQALVTKFKPDSKNFARVLVYNDAFDGPPSATIDFDTPEGVPSSVQSFEAHPIGSSAFNLFWKPPLHPNGKITGYKIYYEVVDGTGLGPKMERNPQIRNPNAREAKLGGLFPNTKYRISIVATTKMGEGAEYFVERRSGITPEVPDVPKFSIEELPSDDGYGIVKVKYIPNIDGKSGSHFYTKYREKGTEKFHEVEAEPNENEQIIRGLNADKHYEFQVVAADGNLVKESEIQEKFVVGNGVIAIPTDDVANAGWFIGMMLALAFIILLLIIVCIIRRNRGGKYDVHDREVANGRRDYPEEGGFHEYSQPLDTKSTGRQSVSSTSKRGPESDTDSMAEYGDGDTGRKTKQRLHPQVNLPRTAPS